MTDRLPFGADTLVIPFTWHAPPPRPHYGMSRNRPLPPDLQRQAIATANAIYAAERLQPEPLAATEAMALTRPPLIVDKGGVGEWLLLAAAKKKNDGKDNPQPLPPGVVQRRDDLAPLQPFIIGPSGSSGGGALGRGGPAARGSMTRPPVGAGADDPATERQRQTLRLNMESAGLLTPGDGRHAHHIVPGGGPMNGSRDPSAAQAMLRNLGVDLDSAQNGVVLSLSFHSRVHTAKYYSLVLNTITSAKSAEEARLRLEQLRNRLQLGDEEFQRTGELPEGLK